MNKKGFTLVELLAVILILAVLIGISSVSYIKIRDNTLEAEYKNVVTYLEGKAIEYANDTNITTISVEDLIKSGYVKADDEIAIYDPRNNTSMNCYIIESTLKDGKYEAKLGDNLVDGDKCGKYTKTSEYQICEIKDGSCTDADFGDWIKTQETITLGVSKGGELLGEGYTFKWSSTTGFNSTESTITLKDLKDKVYVGTYKVEVKKDNELGTSTARIRIDNEKPSIISVDYPEKDWSQEKTVTVKATDNEGSGIERVYLSTSADCSDRTEYTSDNNELVAKVKENNITYYTCAEDKAHNISNVSDKNKIEIKNIDRTAPTIEVKEKNLVYPITSNYDLLENITVNNEEGGSPIVLTVAKINGEVIKNINTLPVGEYDVVYEVEDRAGNKVTNDEVHLSIFVPKFDLEYTGKEETYEIPATGKYELKLYGAQGANNGGKGAYLLGSINLQKGDKLIVNVGGQNGYNGGGVGPSGTYNGGGATTIKLNGNYIIRAAGGGGGANGTAGGSGNGAGGASVGSGSGVSGTNSGGGSSSPSHQYSCNCDTCGGACIKRDPANCCPAGTTLCFVGVCYDDEHDIALGSSVCEATPCRGGGCVSYAPTYSCNCKTCTSAGNPGKGGANYWNTSLIKSITKNDGMNSGNGSAHITWEDKK